MSSASGRYQIVFNGEIYNFENLRQQLGKEGARFRGHSDTEVILAALERWGVSAGVLQLNGMFAMGIWDRQERRLSLVRDRIGKKPLYYAVVDRSLCFASEMKAFLSLTKFDTAVDEAGLRQFLAYGYTQHPLTIYRDVRQVCPGEILHFREGVQSGKDTFWQVPFPTADLIEGSHHALVSVLERAVQERLVADVSLGLFLSAGIDSSVVAALAQRGSARAVRSFTIGFKEDEHDESRYSERIAKRIGTDHTTIYLSQRDALDMVPELPRVFDSPFGDSSALPTLLVCRAARREVTVALSGDGGDEVFGGYHNYQIAPQLWKKMRSLPAPARQLLARFSGGRGAARTLHTVSRIVSVNTDRQITPLRIREMRQGLVQDSFASFYADFYLRIWKHPDMLLQGDGALTPSILPQNIGDYEGLDEREIMMAIDLQCYLPSDVLVKVDRSSMANSLEVRSPLLDTRVIETARRLPLAQRAKKQILREIAYDLVGRDLLDRPKQGFSVPLGAWLRGELRPWAEELLDPHKRDPRLNAGTLREVWQEHLSGRIDNSFRLWNLLSYEAWRRECAKN